MWVGGGGLGRERGLGTDGAWYRGRWVERWLGTEAAGYRGGWVQRRVGRDGGWVQRGWVQRWLATTELNQYCLFFAGGRLAYPYFFLLFFALQTTAPVSHV